MSSSGLAASHSGADQNGKRRLSRLSSLEWSTWLVWVFILAYALYFSLLTIRTHQAFQTTAFDLGNVDQAVWNTHEGRILAMTNIEGLDNRLGTHVEPVLLLVALFYFVWSDPRMLLLFQSIVLALGAWPMYLIARNVQADNLPRELRSNLFPLGFSLAYLLFPALQSANAFDFHAVALAPTFFLGAFYCQQTERWGGYAVCAALTMACKEDMPLLVAMLGLYVLVVRRRWLVGLMTVAAAFGWFLAAVGWIMPRFDARGVSPLANRYAYLGDSVAAMIVTIVTRPGLVLQQLVTVDHGLYVLKLLAPVGFLSLLAPQVLVLAAPSLLVNLLSTDGFMQQLEGFHYGVTLVPVVVLAGAYGAARLIRRLSRYRRMPMVLALLLVATSIVYQISFGFTPLALGFSDLWPQVTAHHAIGEVMAEHIPQDASLAALPYLNPHASQRIHLTMIDRLEGARLAPLRALNASRDAEYVWLDVTNGWPLHPNDLKAGVDALLQGAYGIEQARDGWLLLKQGAGPKTLPDSFYSFVQVSSPQPQYPMQVQFMLDDTPLLEFLGFDLDIATSRPHATTLHLYWRALESLPSDLHLHPFFFDDATGQVLEDTTLRPMIGPVWYPPERWVAGTVVRTSTLPWHADPEFSVGLGVFQGSDWTDRPKRLTLRVESSDVIVRLFDDDTVARLISVRNAEPRPERRLFAAPSMSVETNAELGGKAKLLGAEMGRFRCRDECTLSLVLYWQASQRLDTSYTVFVQLLDPAGRVRAQVDSIPQDGGYPTIWWLPGEVVPDPLELHLPADAPRDVNYTLIAGLYNAQTGVRLPLSDTNADFVLLTTLRP